MKMYRCAVERNAEPLFRKTVVQYYRSKWRTPGLSLAYVLRECSHLTHSNVKRQAYWLIRQTNVCCTPSSPFTYLSKQTFGSFLLGSGILRKQREKTKKMCKERNETKRNETIHWIRFTNSSDPFHFINWIEKQPWDKAQLSSFRGQILCQNHFFLLFSLSK